MPVHSNFMFSERSGWNLAQNRYTVALERYRASGRELLDLTASNPTTVGFQYESERLLRSLADPRALVYEPASTGMLSARQAVSDYYSDKGIAVDPRHIILTVSTSEAYSYCFRLLCNPGDELLVPRPSYPLFDFLADLNDVKLVPYELVYDYGWQIDFHSLERSISLRSRAVLVVNPNNPTGSFVKQAEAETLAHLCAEHELAIISDEVFLDYTMEKAKPYSFAEQQSALTFTLSGLSKISCLPQMKVAWIAVSGPDALRDEALARLEVIADTYLSVSAPQQWALPELLASRQEIQAQLTRRVESNLSFLDLQLQQQTLCTRLRMEGGWYVVLRVPVSRTDEELAIELLEQHGVLVQPGHFFDFPSEGYLVVSLITPEAQFNDGVQKLLAFLHA